VARRKALMVAVGVLACLVGGWVYYKAPKAMLSDMARVRPGMSPAEVASLLGRPDGRLENGKDEANPGYSIMYDLADGNVSVEYTPSNEVRRIRWQVSHSRLHQWFNRLF
jgi:hypothetical protein